MTTTQNITQRWFNDALTAGMKSPEQPGRYLWNWPIQVVVGDNDDTTYCQSPTIWEGGVEFNVSSELSKGTRVRIRRCVSPEEPWAVACIYNVRKDKEYGWVAEASFDA